MAAGENSNRETINELPEQVLRFEIFTRLPVKSLVRCKSVCKSWLALLSDPKFALEHYICCAMQNPNEYDCLVAHKYSTGLVVLSRQEETCILSPNRYKLKLIGSINGLVCLLHNNRLWLWNPVIHQCKEFMTPQGKHPWYCDNFGFGCDNFGFGFDPVSNDYKVIDFNNLFDFKNWYLFDFKNRWYDDMSTFVYSFNSDTWSHLSVPDSVIPTNREQISYHPSAIVKDCPYWTSFYTHWSDEFVAFNALKFEMRSNEFKLLPEFQCKSGENTILVNMMDRPTLMDYQQHTENPKVDVYSLDEDGTGVWSKMYSVVGQIANCYLGRQISQGFKYCGEIVLYKDGILCYYDHTTDTISPTPGDNSSFVVSCCRYTPSLIFLKGMELDTPLVSDYSFTLTHESLWPF